MFDTSVSELEAHYAGNQYADEFRPIDFYVVHNTPCDVCGDQMRYVGLMKGSHYVGIAHCDTCGNEYEL